MVETFRCSARAFMLVALTAASFVAAADQPPSDAQLIAIRQSCRGDYEKVCADVPTGGAPALQCLKENILKVSQPCQAALAAVRPTTVASVQKATAAAAAQPKPGATAPTKTATATGNSTMLPGAAASSTAPGAPTARPPGSGAPSNVPLREEVMIARQACGVEYKKFCQTVQPGGGRAIACLEANDAALSPACKKVVANARQRM